MLAEWFFGDSAAFATFYARHWGRTVVWLKSRGLSGALADDVAQEAFLRLHAHIGSYDRVRPALPWFFTIVRSALVDFFRRESRVAARARAWKSEAEAPYGALGAEGDRETEAERRTLIERALASLSSEQRDLVLARVFEEESYDSLAERSGKSAPSLRKAIERILKKLRARMNELE